MKIDFIRIHSGFANVPDSVVILPPDQDSFPADAPTDWYSCDLPSGFELSEDCIGDTKLYYHGNEVTAYVQDCRDGTHLQLCDGSTPYAIFETIV